MIKYAVTVDLEKLNLREVLNAVERLGVDPDTEFVVEPRVYNNIMINTAGTYTTSYAHLPTSPIKITFHWTEEDNHKGDYFEK